VREVFESVIDPAFVDNI
jgi:uncharacterized protein with von Willebrand factor type A (vWA) domain